MSISWWDTLRNFVTGFGTAKDPRNSAKFYLEVLQKVDLENAYRSDWVARKIVDSPAEDCTREWRQWQASNDQIEAIEDVERTHGLQHKIKKAIIRGRLYGGGALVLGVDDGNMPDEAVDLERVKKDALKFVVVLNRWELNAGPRIYNVDSPWYTRPAYYTVATPMFGFYGEAGMTFPSKADTPLSETSGPVANERELMQKWAGMVRIHPSRVIEFSGNELPDWRLAPMGGGWGDSVLQTAYDTLRDLGLVIGGTAAMINDAKMDVIKIPNLSKTLSNKEYANKLIERFTLSNQSKSIINTLLLDKDEEWSRIQTNFGGLPPLIHEYLTIMAGAGGIPLSRLFGEAKSKGLGESGGIGGGDDLRNYYDAQASYQRTTLTPILNPLDQILIRSALGKYDPDVFYEWAPLWQMGEKDKAAIAYQKAQATQIYVQLGVFNEQVMAEAVMNQLIEDGTYPGLEQAIETYGIEPDMTSQWSQWNPSGEPALSSTGPEPKQIESSTKLGEDTESGTQTTDADEPGHPFRGNQYTQGSDERWIAQEGHSKGDVLKAVKNLREGGSNDPHEPGSKVIIGRTVIHKEDNNWYTQRQGGGTSFSRTPEAALRKALRLEPEMRKKLSDADTVSREAAGVIFRDPDNKMLFMRRVGKDDPHDGEWSIPAGMLENDEPPRLGAQREAAEESGNGGDHRIRHLETRVGENGLTFHTFVQPVHAQFEPIMNEEHDAHVWASPDQPPLPLHPGLATTIARHFLWDKSKRVTRDSRPRTRKPRVKPREFSALVDAINRRDGGID